jgi:hypothetical protein
MRFPPRPALLLAAILVLAPAAAEVPIGLEDRVRNQPEGRCGWCALETLARYRRLEALYGLADKRTSRAAPADLAAVLDEAHVNYRMQDPGRRNTLILRHAVREQLGALVGFREPRPGAGRHIVTLVDFGPTEVRVIDPADADGRTRTLPTDRFLSWWDGFALVLEPADDE